MPILCGLDIASSSGVALIDPSSRPQCWRCFAIEAEGVEPWDKAGDLAAALRDVLEADRPDFAIIERPIGVVVDHGARNHQTGRDDDKRMINAKTTITLAALAAASVTVLEAAGIGWAMIAPATWRARYYGKGFRPQKDWKESALEHARLQNIPLPETVRAARDAAEAIGVAVAWQSATFIPARHQRAFMDLRLGHVPEREAV